MLRSERPTCGACGRSASAPLAPSPHSHAVAASPMALCEPCVAAPDDAAAAFSILAARSLRLAAAIADDASAAAARSRAASSSASSARERVGSSGSAVSRAHADDASQR